MKDYIKAAALGWFVFSVLASAVFASLNQCNVDINPADPLEVECICPHPPPAPPPHMDRRDVPLVPPYFAGGGGHGTPPPLFGVPTAVPGVPLVVSGPGGRMQATYTRERVGELPPEPK